jgi:LPXTG-motif cell wall-anchored protein
VNSAGSVIDPLTLVVGLDRPTIVSPATASATVGSPFSFDVRALGCPANFQYALGAGADSWLSIDPETGQLSGTPAAADVGAHTFTLLADTVPGGTTVTQTFTLQVDPAPDAGTPTGTSGDAAPSTGASTPTASTTPTDPATPSDPATPTGTSGGSDGGSDGAAPTAPTSTGTDPSRHTAATATPTTTGRGVLAVTATAGRAASGRSAAAAGTASLASTGSDVGVLTGVALALLLAGAAALFAGRRRRAH